MSFAFPLAPLGGNKEFEPMALRATAQLRIRRRIWPTSQTTVTTNIYRLTLGERTWAG